ncbi:MAG: hypothetical protein ACI8Y4_003762 [Candidatus Poriferisodalaceae bacterium]|jgi:hypothetical protein
MTDKPPFAQVPVNARIKLASLWSLLATTTYILVPSVMVFLCMILPAKANRITNMVLGPLYAATIGGGMHGEWNYYIVGSIIEVIMLAAIVHYARTWPREAASAGRSSETTTFATADQSL